MLLQIHLKRDEIIIKQMGTYVSTKEIFVISVTMTLHY